MPALLGLARAIDRFSSWLGVVIGGVTLLMIGVGLFNVFGRFADRYLGTAFSSNSLLELQWYLFSVIFLLGGAYVLSVDEHVRVDVLYGRLAPSRRALIIGRQYRPRRHRQAPDDQCRPAALTIRQHREP